MTYTQEVLQSMIDSLPSGVTLFGSNLEMVACNHQFRRLLEFPDSLWANGLPSFETLVRFNARRGEYGEGEPEQLARQVIELARKMQPHVFERTRPNGVVLEIRGAPLPGGGFVSIYTDITDRKQAESEAKRYAAYLQAVLNSLPQGVTVTDEHLRLVLWNRMFLEVLDIPEALMRKGVSFQDLARFNAERGEYGPGDPAQIVQTLVERALKFEAHRIERTRPNGHTVEIRGGPMLMEEQVVGFVTTYTDISERISAEEKVRRANDLMTEAISGSPTYVWEVDAQANFTFVQGAEKILGYRAEAMIGRSVAAFQHTGNGAENAASEVWAAMAARRPFSQCLTPLLREDGHPVWISTSGKPIYGRNGSFLGYRGVDVDVTELTLARKALEQMALYDPLTGLANRRKFAERFEYEAARYLRSGAPLSLLVIDIDHFKAINDEFGHLAGDACLKELAAILQNNVRTVDLVARFGGEEFVALLPDAAASGALIVAERLRTAVADMRLLIANHAARPIQMTISVGAASMEADAKLTLDGFIDRADQAVYSAKRKGRNCVCAYPADVGTQS